MGDGQVGSRQQRQSIAAAAASGQQQQQSCGECWPGAAAAARAREGVFPSPWSFEREEVMSSLGQVMMKSCGSTTVRRPTSVVPL
jgi:hypothetical protein